eukprot:2741698-Amphidinium_carterae.1
MAKTLCDGALPSEKRLRISLSITSDVCPERLGLHSRLTVGERAAVIGKITVGHWSNAAR